MTGHEPGYFDVRFFWGSLSTLTHAKRKEHLTLAVVSFYKERIKLVLQLCFLPQVLSTHGKSYQHTEPPTALKRGAHYRQNKPNIQK